MALLDPKELFSPDFVSFLVHRNPELRRPLSSCLEQAGRGLKEEQRVQLFLACGPPHVLKEAQEEFISQGKPSRKKSSSSGSGAPAAMSQGGSNAYNQQFAQQQAQAQQQQLLATLRQQQAQQQGAVGWNVQQPPGRTPSPAPGQAPAAVPANLQMAQLQAAAAAGLTANNPHIQLLLAQQQLQAQGRGASQAQLASQLQAQIHAAAGRGRPGSGPASAPGASGLVGVGSAGNLSALAGINPAMAAALPRPSSAGPMTGGRPLGAGPAGAGMYGPRPAGALGSSTGAAPDSDAATKLKVQAAMKQMKPNEAPKVEPPEGYEWVQCMGKDGKPGWFAVVRAKAQAMRSTGKRKAEEAAAGQPAGKQGGKKKAADDELVAGGGPVNMMLMDDDAVEAEEAAAKGAVVVEAGNVQEEYLLNQPSTLRLVGRLGKEGGVRAVSDAVYPYLSLAAETFLAQLLNSMVKMRLQREDMGKGYFGFEQGDTALRAELYKMREREKREAEKRAEIERDELAKLGASRKKLGEEERKAAQAARQQRDIEQKKVSVGNTLNMLGIGVRGFGSMSKPVSKTGASKPGMTKNELSEAKKAAEGAPASSSTPAPSAAAAGAVAGSQDGTTVKAETSAAAAAAAAGAAGLDAQQASQGQGAASSAAAAGTSPAPLKPMTLQHQLLSAADVSGQSAAPFVAGGVPPRKARDGEEPLRELTLADLVAVLERHPLYCRSPELYTLHTLAAMQADNMK